jgi:hypothetical protein
MRQGFLEVSSERHTAEIRLRAERKAGQLLTEMPKASGTLKRGEHLPPLSSETTAGTRLADLGITRDQSSLWQKLGAMSQDEFDLAIGESVKSPTTKFVMKFACSGSVSCCRWWRLFNL